MACCICLEELTNPTPIACGHAFHELCLAQWAQRRRQNNCCPLCRVQIEVSQMDALRAIDVPGVQANSKRQAATMRWTTRTLRRQNTMTWMTQT